MSKSWAVRSPDGAQRNPGTALPLVGTIPDYAAFIIGPTAGRTRWLHSGYPAVPHLPRWRQCCATADGLESVWLRAREPYHAAPLLGFLGDQPAEFSRRSAERRFTQISKPRLDHRMGEDGVRFQIQPLDDLSGRIPRRADAVQLARLKAGDEFVHRRNIRQRVGVRCRSDGERAQLGGPDVFDGRRHRSKVDLDLAGEQVRKRRAGAPIGYVQ